MSTFQIWFSVYMVSCLILIYSSRNNYGNNKVLMFCPIINTLSALAVISYYMYLGYNRFFRKGED
jgi:hypothetical protein